MKQNGTGICPNCGNQTAPGARFCAKCGTALAQIEDSKSDDVLTYEPIGDQQDPDNDPGKEQQTQIKIALLFGGIIALLIMAVTMGIILISLTHDRAEEVWGSDTEVQEEEPADDDDHEDDASDDNDEAEDSADAEGIVLDEFENATLVVTVPVETMSLRETPGLGTDVIAEVPTGELLLWSGRTESVDGREYYRVKRESTEETGYVASEFCTPVQFPCDVYGLAIVDVSRELYTWEDMVSDVFSLEEEYPEAIRSDVIGYSLDGREIYEVILGNPNAPHQIMVQAGIHGREYMTSMLVMKMLEYYAYYYETGSYGGVYYDDLLGNTAIRVIPMSNPDGISISQFGDAAMEHDDLRDRLYECYENDKETLVHRMDANGYMDWIDVYQDETFDRDKEQYPEIISYEEYLKIWKANARGVDLNCNFDAGWYELEVKDYPSFSKCRGDAPLSEPESEALVRLAEERTYDGFISYHSKGQIIYYDAAGNDAEVSQKSEWLARGLSSINKYELYNTKRAAHVTLGGFSDWLQLEKQAASCTVEMGKMPCPLAISEFPSMWNRNRETWAMLCYDLYSM